MVVTSVHIDANNKWSLVIEGTERGKAVKTYIAIPPTSGDRIDIITPNVLDTGYRYDVELIVIEIKAAIPVVHLFK